MPTPDLAGFRAAQERKRALMGVDVTFYAEPVSIWPPALPMDAETGRPRDPTVEPLSSAAASAVIRCGVAYRSTGPQVEAGAPGLVQRTDVMLIADAGAGSAIEPMVRFQARGDEYLIEARKFDGVGPIDRYLVWGSLA